MKRRGLLLDRDGVVNIDHGYIGTVERFDFTPGLFPFLRAAQDRGYRLAILTNQSGVARGYYTTLDHKKVTEWMLSRVREQGIAIDLVLASFELPDTPLAEWARQSFWRKPNPGMVLEAALRLDLDLSRSVMIGDKDSDMKAAEVAGVGTRLLFGQDEAKENGVVPVKDFDAALRIFD